MPGSITDSDEQAGAVEPFRDAALYDWEYRRRRNDIAFYRMLAGEREGPILDLGCGTGRLLAPLARDGQRVVGVDLSPAMLAAAAARVHRLPRAAARRCLLVKADLRALPIRGHFPLVIAAFHTVQHLIDDRELLALFRAVRRLIRPDGWFAFDVFFPDPNWLARPANRQFDRTMFRHPTTGQKMAYSVSHRLDTGRRALHMQLHYQSLDETGDAVGPTRTVRLCHRQLPPRDVNSLLRRSGLEIVARWGGFDGEVLPARVQEAPKQEQGEEDREAAASAPTEQHVYLARATSLPERRRQR
ncbi:MAG: class I SAM-dependent methyltransferase [Myxococcales bacterium]